MTLNDLSTLPARPLTEAELSSLNTSGWKRHEVEFSGKIVFRIAVCQNNGQFWVGDELYGNITPQCKPLDAVQVIFYRDLPNGVRVTQPIEVEPTEDELRSIASHRRALGWWRENSNARSVRTQDSERPILADTDSMLSTLDIDV